jgi:hypothetical protein
MEGSYRGSKEEISFWAEPLMVYEIADAVQCKSGISYRIGPKCRELEMQLSSDDLMQRRQDEDAGRG